MRTRTLAGRAAGTAAILLFASAAAAQAGDGDSEHAPMQPNPTAASTAPETTEPATGKMAFAVPEATAPVARSFHVHDGFYARASAGIGWVGTDWSVGGGAAGGDIEAKGTSLALDLMIGGSPSRGVAIGGALLSHLMLATDVSSGGQDLGSGDVNLFLVGPFIDGFPSATQGWHFGGTIGLARAKLSIDDSLETWGLGGAAWAGYDAWVGDEWSVGGLGRFMLTRTNGEDDQSNDISATAMAFTLSVTALFH